MAKRKRAIISPITNDYTVMWRVNGEIALLSNAFMQQIGIYLISAVYLSAKRLVSHECQRKAWPKACKLFHTW